MGSDNNTLKLIDREIEKLSNQTDVSFVDAKKLETLQRVKEIIVNRSVQEAKDEYSDVTDKQILEILTNDKKKKTNKQRKGN